MEPFHGLEMVETQSDGVARVQGRNMVELVSNKQPGDYVRV